MAVTLAQIARRLGVSEATVSRVLNGRATSLISKSTAERVLAVAAEMGYRAGRVAKGAKLGRTGVVALWIRRPDAPYYARIVQLIQQLAAEDGFEMILRGYRDEPTPAALPGGRDRGRNWGNAAWPIDGLLCADCRVLAESYLGGRAPGLQVPIVGMGNDYPGGIDAIGLDIERGADEAVRHLLAMGCRRIVHVNAETAIPIVRDGRAARYRSAVEEAGLTARVITIPVEGRALAREAMLAHVREHGPPDGVFCMNDDIAMGVYRALRDLDLRIPDDVALVGCDDIEDVSYLDVPLSTIRQPTDELCGAAWQALRRRMAEPRAPLLRELITPHLVVRRSSQRVNAPAPVVETVARDDSWAGRSPTPKPA